MIELPEAKSLSEQLLKKFYGKTITYVVANHSPHKLAWFWGDPNGYGELLCGKKITGSNAVAGHVEMHAEDCCISFEGGVTLRYLEAGESDPSRHQLYIRFDDGTALVGAIQMYGGLYAYVEGQNDNYYYIMAKEKPSPLTDEFDEMYYNDMFANSKKTLSAKAFLTTEQRIPGLGNGVLQDILFNAHIHPRLKLEAFDNQQKKDLFYSIKHVLNEMVVGGGRDVEKDIFGNQGKYKTKMSTLTRGKQCPVCGDTIMCEAFLGGKIYYCPTCQPYVKG